MSKRKTSAAIVGLLADLKQSGIQTVSEMLEDDSKPQEKTTPAAFFSTNESSSQTAGQSEIEYVIKKLNVSSCEPWNLANRLSEYISLDSCSELIENINQVGQQIPILVRKSKVRNGYDVICGARRLFSCKHLGIDVLAAIVDLTDQEALLAMDAENRPRQDISPYERALDYQRWVKTGIYKNYSEIGDAIGVKKAWFSQLMALTELNEEIIRAFKHPANLKLKWGYRLSLISKKNMYHEKRIVELAISLQGQNLTPEQVYRKLICVEKENESQLNQTDWITDARNKKLFGVKQDFYGRTQFIFNKSIPKDLLDDVINQVKELIEAARANEV